MDSTVNDNFKEINERAVDDISLEVFYKPHSVTLWALCVVIVIYLSLVRDESNVDDNIWAGLLCVLFFLLIISAISFPNGPFTRPHPSIWRMVFGLSIMYLLFLVFLLFQDYKTSRSIFLWFDPKLKDFNIDMDKEYGVNCSDITVEKIWAHIDVFALGHFLGWAFKAILARHWGILWAMSVMWEITEIAFAHLLPNFVECWWDALILDILLCNGIGIWVGLKICKILEMREYKWILTKKLVMLPSATKVYFLCKQIRHVSKVYLHHFGEKLKDIHSTSGKLKRAVMQFTPVSWTYVRWLDPNCTYMRFFAVCQMVIFWQISELNTFFLKHIFEMPPSHPLVIGRLIFLGILVAPSARQYYSFVTDPECKRLGNQCWVFGAVMIIESLLCIKNGKTLFGRTQAINIIIWVLIMLLLSVLCVYGFMAWQWYFHGEKQKEDVDVDTSPLNETKLTPHISEIGKTYSDGNISELRLRQKQQPNGMSSN